MKPRRKLIFRLHDDMAGVVCFRYGRDFQYAEVKLIYNPGQKAEISPMTIMRPDATITMLPSGVRLIDKDPDRTYRAIWTAVYQGYKDNCRTAEVIDGQS